MRWQQKAAVARVCAALPLGERLYRAGQRRFGELRAQPGRRLAAQVEMVRWLSAYGMQAEDRDFFEVGTGHIPVVPMGFFLSGARQCLTVDLNRRIDWELTAETLRWIAAHQDEVGRLYQEVTDRELFSERLAKVVELKNNPRRFFDQAAIRYLAPQDAAQTGLPGASIDCHFSMTVLEHVAPQALEAILREARRILKPGGVALHFIDPGDHFAHSDRSISAINFLRYSERDWRRLAGNEFAYCNRLRASDLLRLAAQAGFRAVRTEITVDERARHLVAQGFQLDTAFRRYEPDDLCATSLHVLWA
jgi:SAM-dependent methyltransferase